MIKTGKPAVSIIINLITAALIFLWVYAAMSKLINYEQSRSQMLNQVFSKNIAKFLVWAVPLTELLLSGLLSFFKTRLIGLYGSLILLISFTVYIGLVMNHVFGRVPCSCGGVLSKMSWEQHLIFNVVFIVLTIGAILLSTYLKKGGNMGKGL